MNKLINKIQKFNFIMKDHFQQILVHHLKKLQK